MNQFSTVELPPHVASTAMSEPSPADSITADSDVAAAEALQSAETGAAEAESPDVDVIR